MYYGNPILRKNCHDVPVDKLELDELITNMWQTLQDAGGVGLAAPQVGRTWRLFLVDSVSTEDSNDMARQQSDALGIQRAFVNPTIISYGAKKVRAQEGCLSIPGIWVDVMRSESVVVDYFDEQLNRWQEEFTGPTARIIQHEYDHINGTLFLDHLSPMTRRLLQKKLNVIRRQYGRK